MIFIRLRIGVTAYTGEFRVIIGVGMAICTLIPFALMRSAVDWKVLTVVVKISWCPRIFRVTACTAGRKSCCCMVGICGCVIVCQVTAYTGVGRIVVIAVMTGSTVIGNGRMRAIERIVIVVVGKRCRCPAGLGGVATGTVIAKAQGYVVGVAGLVEVRCMAARTGVGGIGVISVVTSRAVIDD